MDHGRIVVGDDATQQRELSIPAEEPGAPPIKTMRDGGCFHGKRTGGATAPPSILMDFSSADHDFAATPLSIGAPQQTEDIVMQRTLVTFRYRFTSDAALFRSDLGRAAPVIAGTPGLIWKIWGLDPARGIGTSAYLFDSTEAAAGFATGPLMNGFRQRPDVADVVFETAPLDADLSAQTRAAFL